MLSLTSDKVKNKKQKYHTVVTAPISNNNIVERKNKNTTLLEQLQYLITTS
jgi:hypothetical protein